MDASKLRQRIHGYIEIASNKKIKALYTILENEISQNDYLKKDELDSRYESFKNGTAKMFSSTENRQKIQEILKRKGKHS